MNIKILRMHDGLDIITEVISKSGLYYVKNPMMFLLDDEDEFEPNLLMRHWSPIDFIKSNETIIMDRDILCVYEPTDAIVEFYTNIIEKETRDLIKQSLTLH